MFLGKPFAGLVMFGLFCLLSGTAYSQQVLVCYTLHNDLVNFDRRAHSVNHYFMPELGEAREAALRADSPLCISSSCKERARYDIERYHYLLMIWERSPLGGADPVRQRILEQMRLNGCPGEGSWYERNAVIVRAPDPDNEDYSRSPFK